MNTLIIRIITTLASFASVWSTCGGPGTTNSRVTGARPSNQQKLVILANLNWGNEYIVSWKNTIRGIDHYSFHATAGTTSFKKRKKVKNIKSTTNTNVEITLERNQEYIFVVKAFHAGGTMLYQAKGRIKIPEKFSIHAPLIAHAKKPVDQQVEEAVQQVTVHWKTPSTDAKKYHISVQYFEFFDSEWKKDESVVPLPLARTTSKSYAFEADRTGRYDIRVYAVDRKGQRIIGDEISTFRTEVSPSVNITEPEDSLSFDENKLPVEIQVKWDAVPKVTKFMLQVRAHGYTTTARKNVISPICSATVENDGDNFGVTIAGLDKKGQVICWGHKEFFVQVTSEPTGSLDTTPI